MLILCYHKIINVKLFENHLEYLKRNYQVISPEQFLRKIQRLENVYENDVLITFDDGDISLYTNAFPLLKRYQIPALAFVITSLINTKIPFWWDEVIYYTGAQSEVRRLKNVSNNERVDYLCSLRQSHKEPMLYEQLTLMQLKDLENGGVAIASHTHSHPLLDMCDDETVYYELKTSKELLRKWGFPFYNVIAYPNGNFNQRISDAVQNTGYMFSFLFNHEIAQNPLKPYAISRLRVSDETPMWKFKLILSGIHSLQLKWRNGLFL